MILVGGVEVAGLITTLTGSSDMRTGASLHCICIQVLVLEGSSLTVSEARAK